MLAPTLPFAFTRPARNLNGGPWSHPLGCFLFSVREDSRLPRVMLVSTGRMYYTSLRAAA